MKEDITEFVLQCPGYYQVKVEHQRPYGVAHNIEIHKLKWKMIHIDFIISLTQSGRQQDPIWVIVDRINKLANFLPIKMIDNVENYDRLFIRETV